MRIGIIGIGHVGTSVAFSILQTGIAREILLYDIDHERAEGEAMDLAHGVPYYPTASVGIGSFEEVLDSDVVIFSAGRGGRPGESRLDLLKDNVNVVRNIGRRLSDSRGIIIIVSNPVDILTKAMTEVSGLPTSRVIGTGTMLDTSRLRQRLAGRLNIDARSIHAYVIGEHGDSEIVLWSSARIGGRSLRSLPSWNSRDEAQISEEVRRAAYEIIRRKGATNHAIGLVTADLIRSVVRDEHRVLTVSRLQEGVKGMEDVAFSMPAIVSAKGAGEVLEPELDELETRALAHSVKVLREAAASVS
jgi:L-lactate dehydrogenase